MNVSFHEASTGNSQPQPMTGIRSFENLVANRAMVDLSALRTLVLGAANVRIPPV